LEDFLAKGKVGGLALLTNIPAPYRLPALNHLARLKGTQFQVWFIAASEPKRWWRIPVERMNFEWRFLTEDSNADSLLTATKASAKVVAFLARSQPKAVICGGYNSLPAWVTFAWCKLFRRRFVLWSESTARDRRKPGKLGDCLKRFFVSRVDGFAAQGKASAAYAKQLGLGDDRIFIAPFGGDNEVFAREAGEVDAAQQKKLLGFCSRLILFSGRLSREKGVFVLLEAFRQIASELPDTGLLLVGHGPEREAMEHFCQRMGMERVYFVGPQEHDRMPYYYALAEVLVLPSFSDPWGFVVNEAFACGVPAVVSLAAGVCEDLIVEGETGFAVEPGNVQELADKILCLLKDESLRARMRENCRHLIQKYSAVACAQGLLAAATGTRHEVRC
jgi:glycosyltransferase involved in cell wall biosynthesis